MAALEGCNENLVKIILSNNGYEVINLRIKVPPEVPIREFRRTKAGAIGLSGLLVRNAQQTESSNNKEASQYLKPKVRKGWKFV